MPALDSSSLTLRKRVAPWICGRSRARGRTTVPPILRIQVGLWQPCSRSELSAMEPVCTPRREADSEHISAESKAERTNDKLDQDRNSKLASIRSRQTLSSVPLRAPRLQRGPKPARRRLPLRTVPPTCPAPLGARAEGRGRTAPQDERCGRSVPRVAREPDKVVLTRTTAEVLSDLREPH